jgi:predicted enzyme related to lactoylglutathione lyase
MSDLVFRPGGVSYLRIPADDPSALADFYGAVFGWSIRAHGDSPAFDDGTGHVIGHFVSDQPAAGEGGVRPYVYVASVEETLAAAVARGAEVVEATYPEGDLLVATFRDPGGNVIGVWQQT